MKPRIPVDFNELIEHDLVLLSQTDFKHDSEGNIIEFKEGMMVQVFMEDLNDSMEKDYLIADGTVELNSSGVFPVCKWVCRLDQNGIRHASDVG